MIEPSPDRQSYNKRIQETQSDIDKKDSKLDNKIDIKGLKPEEKEAMKIAYIDKVNMVQGKVHRSFQKIDLQRNLRSPQWRKWEKSVVGVEVGLVKALRSASNSPKTELAEFANTVDALLREIDTVSNTFEVEEPLVPRSIASLFHEWDVPGSDTEVASKAKKAIAHYGEEKIRTLAAALSLFDALDPSLRERLFNSTATVKLQQVAGQLVNGTFESSPLAFLLTENFSAIEDQLLMERESVLDDIDVKNAKVQTLNSATNEKIVQLCTAAGMDVGTENILSDIYSWIANTNGKPELQEKIIDEIRNISTQLTGLQEETAVLYPQILDIERAFNTFDTSRALNTGNTKEEAQLRFRGAMEYGEQIPNYSALQKYLRSSQKNLIEGKPEKALRISIDELNAYIYQNPNLDTLDRIDVLSLRGVRDRGKTSATFRESIQPNYGPFNIYTRKRSKLKMHLFADSAPQTYTEVSALGTLEDGREIILVDLPAKDGRPGQKAIALRNANGVVQLQGGTVLENPKEMLPIRIDARHEKGETVYVTPETKNYLRNTIRFGSKNRVTLRGSDDMFSKEPVKGFADGEIRTLDLSQLQRVSRYDDGIIKIYNANDKEEESFNEEQLRKGRTEHGGDVLLSIDKNPLIQDITRRAGGLQGNMQNMQKMLGTAMDSNATTQGAFIDQLRSYARPMLETMENPTTLQNVVQAKKLLQSELSRVQLGSFVGNGIEREIQDRIDALDGYIAVLDDNQLKNALQNAMELKPDQWGEWLSTDGLIMLGAITAAVVAIVALTVLTGGVGLIAVSAVGAAGGMAGAELTKEGLHYGYNTWGGASTGEYRYTDRSRIGAYFEGQKLYDPKTKEFIDMSFLENVASPYAGEFLLSFGTTALALGAGQMAGKALSQLAQNTKFLQNLAKNNGVANSIMKKLSGLADDAARIPKNLKEFTGNAYKEIIDELKDELILEAGVAQGLMRIDERLAFLSTFIVATGKGFKPLKGGKFSYGARMSNADVKAWAKAEGHTVVSEVDGVLDVQTFDGNKLILSPETAEESALELAKQGKTASLKAYMKTHDVDDGTRITLAEALLGRTMDQAERDALIAAHDKPGVIDELSPAELKAKTAELRKSSTITKAERRILIEAGLAGVGVLEAPTTHTTPLSIGDAINLKDASIRLGNGGRFTESFTATGRERTAAFEVTYSGSGRTFTAEISSPDYPRVKIIVHYQIKKSGKGQAYVELGKMGELSGAGLYSSILNELFEGVDFIEASIGNEETNVLFRDHSQESQYTDELEALDGDYKEPRTVPYSVLMTYSPTASSRKGFITRAERGTPIDLISERVHDPELQSLLDISQGWERSRRVDTPHYTRRFYEQHPKFSLVELTQKFEAYLEANPDLDAFIAESLTIQIEHMKSYTQDGSTDNGLNYKQQLIVYLNANTIGNKDRISLARDILGRELTPKQQGALMRAHKVGMDREGASIGNYTDAELFKKGRILMALDSEGKPLFSRAEADLLLETGLAGIPGRIGSWVKGLVGGKTPEVLPVERVSLEARELLGSDERVAEFESMLDLLDASLIDFDSREVDTVDAEELKTQMEEEGFTSVEIRVKYGEDTGKSTVSGSRPHRSSPEFAQGLLPFFQHFKDPLRAMQILNGLCKLDPYLLSATSIGMKNILAEPNAEQLLLRIEPFLGSVDGYFGDISEIFEVVQSLSDSDLDALHYLNSRSSDRSFKFRSDNPTISIAQNEKCMELARRMPPFNGENLVGTIMDLGHLNIDALNDLARICPELLFIDTGPRIAHQLQREPWRTFLGSTTEQQRELFSDFHADYGLELREGVMEGLENASQHSLELAQVRAFCLRWNIFGIEETLIPKKSRAQMQTGRLQDLQKRSSDKISLADRLADPEWMEAIQDPEFGLFLQKIQSEFGYTCSFVDILSEPGIYTVWQNEALRSKIKDPEFRKLLRYSMKISDVANVDEPIQLPDVFRILCKEFDAPIGANSSRSSIIDPDHPLNMCNAPNPTPTKLLGGMTPAPLERLAALQEKHPTLVGDLIFLSETYGIDFSDRDLQQLSDNIDDPEHDSLEISYLRFMLTPGHYHKIGEILYSDEMQSTYKLLHDEVAYEFNFDDIGELYEFDPENIEDDRLALEAAKILREEWKQGTLFTERQICDHHSNKEGTFFSEKELLASLGKEGKARKAARAYSAVHPLLSAGKQNSFPGICAGQVNLLSDEDLTDASIEKAREVYKVLSDAGLNHFTMPQLPFLVSCKNADKKTVVQNYAQQYPIEFLKKADGDMWAELQGMDFNPMANAIAESIGNSEEMIALTLEQYPSFPKALQLALERIGQPIGAYMVDLNIPCLRIYEEYRRLAAEGEVLRVQGFVGQMHTMADGLFTAGPTDPDILESPYYKDLVLHFYPNHAGQWYTFAASAQCADRTGDLAQFDIDDSYGFDLGEGVEMQLKDGIQPDEAGLQAMQDPIRIALQKLAAPDVNYDKDKMLGIVDTELDALLAGTEHAATAKTREEKIFVLLLDSMSGDTTSVQLRSVLILYQMAEFEDVRGYLEGTRATSEKAKNPEYAYLIQLHEFFADNLKEVSRKICNDATENPEIEALLPEYFNKKQQVLQEEAAQAAKNRARVDRLGLSDSFVKQIAKTLKKRTGKTYTPERVRQIIDRYETLRRKLQEHDATESTINPANRSRAFIGQLDNQRRQTEQAIEQLSGESGVDLSTINLGDINLADYLDARTAVGEGTFDQEQFEQYVTQSFQEVFSTDIHFIETELAKYEPAEESQREKKQRKVECIITKSAASAHARGTAGVCVSQDNPNKTPGDRENIWDMENYYQMVIRDPVSKICQGCVLMHVYEHEGKQVLVASFNPSSTYLFSVDETQMFNGLLGALQKFADANEIDTIAVSTNSQIRTNRTGGEFENEMNAHVTSASKRISFDGTRPFSFRPTYSLQEVDVLWERDSSASAKALELANTARESGDISALKAYLKTPGLTVGKQLRLKLASALLNRPLTPTEQQRILAAHNKPGVIDELSPEELNAKTAELRKSSTITKAERRLLIEAGLAGEGFISAEVEPNGAQRSISLRRLFGNQDPALDSMQKPKVTQETMSQVMSLRRAGLAFVCTRNVSGYTVSILRPSGNMGLMNMQISADTDFNHSVQHLCQAYNDTRSPLRKEIREELREKKDEFLLRSLRNSKASLGSTFWIMGESNNTLVLTGIAKNAEKGVLEYTLKDAFKNTTHVLTGRELVERTLRVMPARPDRIQDTLHPEIKTLLEKCECTASELFVEDGVDLLDPFVSRALLQANTERTKQPLRDTGLSLFQIILLSEKGLCTFKPTASD
jgi:hypothetical protein